MQIYKVTVYEGDCEGKKWELIGEYYFKSKAKAEAKAEEKKGFLTDADVKEVTLDESI